MFQDIIELILKNKASLNTDKDAEILAYAKELDVVKTYMAELDVKYQEREEKLNKMLEEAGYVEPVEEQAEEAQVVETTNNEDWR